MQKFSVQEAFKFGWETFKKYPVFLIGVVLIVGILSSITNSLTNMLSDGGQTSSLMSFLVSIAGSLIQMILSLGMLKIAITLARGGKPQWEDLYMQYPKFLNYLIASILYGLMVVIGLVLLVIPGIYLAVKYQMYSYLIVDKNLGPIEALKESAVITKGNMWNLFLFILTSIVVVVIGVILFLVGLLVAVPIVMVAGGYVYTKLAK